MHTVSGCMLVNLGLTIYCNMHLILDHMTSAYQGIILGGGPLSLSLSILSIALTINEP